MTFATSGPGLVLPDGYTVNSVDAQISDNQWLGAALPEPSVALLLALGGAPAFVAKKRRLS